MVPNFRANTLGRMYNFYMKKATQDKLIKFRDDRKWSKFHTNENLAKAVSIESGELLELFLWDSKFNKDKLKDEIADVAMYLEYLAIANDIDIEKEVLTKLKRNEERFPVEKNQGVVKRNDK